MTTPGYVARRTVTTTFRKKFDAKLGLVSLYQPEKDLVLAAVKEHGYDSISAFSRESIREKLERMGYPVPPDEDFVKTEEG